MNLQLRDRIVTIMCDKIEQLRLENNQDWNLYDLANAIVTELKLQPEHDHGTTYPNPPSGTAASSDTSPSGPTMTDLRTRIAKVLYGLYGPSLGAHPWGWDQEPGGIRDSYLADADAVIRELGQGGQ